MFFHNKAELTKTIIFDIIMIRRGVEQSGSSFGS